MTERIFRYEVPVDDQWHSLTLSGRVLAVDCRESSTVEFWAISSDDITPQDLQYRVFATGQPLEPDAVYVGTAVTPGGFLVWHLLQRLTVGRLLTDLMGLS